MKTIRLKKLTIQNFKGIESFVFDVGGKSATILGVNASGKTTIADAVSWLLFDKDSKGNTKFQLKPTDLNGIEIHKLNIEVEGIFLINDSEITLKKLFFESYGKKKNRGQYKHKTKFWLNDVTKSKTEYTKEIAGIILINTWKLLTNPFAFSSLPWKEQREILIEFCGGVTNEEVIKSDLRLAEMANVLEGKSIENQLNYIKDKQDQINLQLDQIPAKIEENQEKTKGVQAPDLERKKKIDEILKNEITILNSIRSNEAISEKQIQINEIDAQIIAVKNEFNEILFKKKTPFLSESDRLLTDRRIKASEIEEHRASVSRNEKRIKVVTGSLDKIREHWYTVNKEVFKPLEKCPVCNSTMPENSRKEAAKRFNLGKAEQLKSINEEGSVLAKGIENRTNEILQATNWISELEKDLVVIDKKFVSYQKTLTAINKEEPDASALEQKKTGIESSLFALKNGSLIQEKTALQRIEDAQENVDAWVEKNFEWKATIRAMGRIEKLLLEEKDLASAYEKLERKMFLIKLFVKKKIELLEIPINSVFKLAKFKLFDQLVNGGVEECCEVLFEGVPFWKGLNSAAQINVGLEIISVLSKRYGVKAPIFIDNSESIIDVFPINTQIIELRVCSFENLIALGFKHCNEKTLAIKIK